MENLFIELLQVALGSRDALSRVPSATEWEDLIEEAKRQCVLSLLLDGLERLSDKEKPSKRVLLQWIGLHQLTEGAYYLQCQRAKELTALFQKEGYKCCVLKGVGLAQLYPHPEHRQCGDIDLWVKGDSKDILRWLRTRYALEHVFWHHAEAKIFNDVETEIHYHAGWMYNPFRNHWLQKWFGMEIDAQMVVSDELGFAYPTVRFNAVYSLVHFYHHLIEEGVGLRHIVDYFYIVKALPVEDRASVVATLRRFGLYKLACAVMWVLAEVCGMSADNMLCEPDSREGKFLLDEIMRGGNFGHYRTDNRRRNTAARMMALFPHYPTEVVWVLPWKLWHKCWRLVNG